VTGAMARGHAPISDLSAPDAEPDFEEIGACPRRFGGATRMHSIFLKRQAHQGRQERPENQPA
jgi:hypothetical protein